MEIDPETIEGDYREVFQHYHNQFKNRHDIDMKFDDIKTSPWGEFAKELRKKLKDSDGK